MYFNDGTLCYQGWQSCASCHSSDARVDGMNWDLLNDGMGNPKNVKSLLFSFQTPPVMSMGVRSDAAAAIRAGIQHILFTTPREAIAAPIDAYIKTLLPNPSPYLVHNRLSPEAERGRKLFFSEELGCSKCHPPPLFTDQTAHPVGPGKFDQAADEFYTPTLIELWRTAPYLHAGSAATLRDAVLTHNPANLRGQTSHLRPEQIDQERPRRRSLFCLPKQSASFESIVRAVKSCSISAGSEYGVNTLTFEIYYLGLVLVPGVDRRNRPLRRSKTFARFP
jgi:cytochrome c peroxidase